MEEEKKHIVYMHVNKHNNKIYIGITGQRPENRWNNGNGYKYNTHFRNAIEKYGWDGFVHKILYEDLTREEACEKEIWLIALFNTTDPQYGYNLTLGGERNIGRKCSEETKKKISEANKGENNGMYGKKHTKEARKKISEAGKIHNTKKVKQYNKNGEFIAIYISASEAERETGIRHSHISEVCRGIHLTAGGYIWKHADEEELE